MVKLTDLPFIGFLFRPKLKRCVSEYQRLMKLVDALECGRAVLIVYDLAGKKHWFEQLTPVRTAESAMFSVVIHRNITINKVVLIDLDGYILSVWNLSQPYRLIRADKLRYSVEFRTEV